MEWRTVTEADWNACVHPKPMLSYLRGPGRATRSNAGRRKLRLFGCACCRRAWNALSDERSRQAVEQAEHYADGALSCEGLRRAFGPAHGAYDDAVYRRKAPADAALIVIQDQSWSAATAWRTIAGKQTTRLTGSTSERETAAQAALLRCIFGNPFCPPLALASSVLAWNQRCVVRLARAAYDERLLPEGILDPARLAILADALEEAGCNEVKILGHLRGSDPHVRGCHVIDTLLSKS